MSDREEWGPWVQHNGKGCPCLGMLVQCVFEDDPGEFSPPSKPKIARGGKSWHWEFWRQGMVGPDGYGRIARIVSYRIRKPRALQQLREMIETLPAPEREDA